MGREIITFGNAEIKKQKFQCYKIPFLKRFLLVKKFINSLLVTWMIIVILGHYTLHAQKRAKLTGSFE